MTCPLLQDINTPMSCRSCMDLMKYTQCTHFIQPIPVFEVALLLNDTIVCIQKLVHYTTNFNQ